MANMALVNSGFTCRVVLKCVACVFIWLGVVQGEWSVHRCWCSDHILCISFSKCDRQTRCANNTSLYLPHMKSNCKLIS